MKIKVIQFWHNFYFPARNVLLSARDDRCRDQESISLKLKNDLHPCATLHLCREDIVHRLSLLGSRINFIEINQLTKWQTDKMSL